MADRVLLVRFHLRCRPAPAVRAEDRVIAEPVRSPRLPGEASSELTAHDALVTTRTRHRRSADEGSTPVRIGYIGELRENELQVRKVVPVLASPSRGEDPRHTTKDVDSEP